MAVKKTTEEHAEAMLKEIEFWKSQAQQFKDVAQKNGSEAASWRHKFLRLEEEHARCKNVR